MSIRQLGWGKGPLMPEGDQGQGFRADALSSWLMPASAAFSGAHPLSPISLLQMLEKESFKS